jgi:protein-S-isoprenylcysteine O-methyltransferase Ste14
MGAFLRYCVDEIEFSPSFICDLIVSTAYVAVTAYLFDASAHEAPSAGVIIFIAVVVLEAQAAKVALMFSLVRRGGDAGLKQSPSLVTDGIYSYSRNPAYLVTIAQNLMWSLLLLLAIVDQPMNIFVVVVILALPLVHFLVLDRLVIRREEANLSCWHPAAYEDYASRVNRWIGRRKQSAQARLSAATSQGR